MTNEIAALNRRVSLLGNLLLLTSFIWVALIGIWILNGRSQKVQAAQLQSLTVKRLAVVDANGIERVVISAPLPDPIINGKRGKRDSPISGVMIYDPKGNERGGYGTSDDKSLNALLTLDSENDQVFTVYANAGSGASLWVSNEKNDHVLMSTHNTAVLEVVRGKQVVYKQPPDAPDLKQ